VSNSRWIDDSATLRDVRAGICANQLDYRERFFAIEQRIQDRTSDRA
jgi:hypothetical protein